MSALVDTPLRCGKVVFAGLLCMEPAVKALVAVQSCGHNPIAYACDEHVAPRVYVGVCREGCAEECTSIYETRPINEGDLPDEPGQQIVGRWSDGSVCLP